MTRSGIVLCSSIAFSTVCLHAQQPQQSAPKPPLSQPAPTPNGTLKSVEVLADRQVQFRIWAPAAAEVKLSAEGGETIAGMTPEAPRI
jgi:hypothetical protein